MENSSAFGESIQSVWCDNNMAMPARFTMLGRLQVQQPLDFSSRSPPHVSTTPPPPGAVDLSTRSRLTPEDSSSNSSEMSDTRPLILQSLLNHHIDPVPSIPVISPQFTNVFKKSPSMTRPFKAYPKDPLSLHLGLVGGVTPAETMLNTASNEAYAEFRRQMLSQVGANKVKREISPLPPMLGKTEPQLIQPHGHPTQPEEAGSPQQPSSSATDQSAQRDPSYWERRRKNNEAAKRSRDARRAKEDEIAIRAAFLEQENLKLKYEVAALRNETTRLRCLLYSS